MNNSDRGRVSGLVQSVDRAITILELLARNGEVGITEIAGQLGVHKSSASRLVYTLQVRQLVEQRGERGRFSLGLGMLRFAGAVTGQLDIAHVGNPVCEALAEHLGETVNIAVLDHSHVIHVSQMRGTSAVAAQNWIGQRAPLHATASGKVLLASAPPSAQENVLSGDLDAFTPRTITDPQRLRQGLRCAVADGYATCLEELEVGLHAVAVPVYGHQHEVVAALSVSGPAYRLPRNRIRTIVDDLRASARDLSSRLGYPAGD